MKLMKDIHLANHKGCTTNVIFETYLFTLTNHHPADKELPNLIL